MAGSPPATREDVERIHERLDNVVEKIGELAVSVGKVNERCMLRGKVTESLAVAVFGSGENGANVGLVRKVDSAIRFKDRALFWLKWAVGLAATAIVTGIGVAVTWILENGRK